MAARFLGGGLVVGGAGAGVPTESDVIIVELSE